MESEIIARIKAGDSSAFGTLYRMHYSRLYAYALSQVKSVQDAEDFVQDIFLALWNTRDRIHNDITLYPLLSTMLRNRIIRFNKARAKEPVTIDCNSELVCNLKVAEFHCPVEYDEFRNMMFYCIRMKLTYTEQLVLKFSRFCDKSNRQISAILGLSDQTVRNALSTGLRKLRHTLLRENVAV